ncbi:tigger transposable element-derived protein 6 [Elysia marginata]|uniref:Tigger transposable element-derived protein 6 n=1 Tax=Elysia marginata TaxID=1093978 RepID=A0AAV4IK02_9GAST|nr:tigger transposable element-derived protein 6 [Elysia marginata]
MTLSDQINGRVSGTKPGCRPVMTDEMEGRFSSKLVEVADQGFGLSKRLVMQRAAEFCRKAKVDHPFKDGPAGESWYRGHMRRQPELGHRTPSKLCANREKAMARVVEKWWPATFVTLVPLQTGSRQSKFGIWTRADSTLNTTR